MKTLKSLKTWATCAGIAAIMGSAQASLVSLGDGTVKDTVTNLIWLQNWNVNGAQDWATQNAWAQNLVFAGSSDWVLPSTLDYVTLFADVGDLTNPALPFTQVQANFYWTATEVVPGGLAESFGPARGLLGISFEAFLLRVVAVHPDVVTATVPAPPTLALVMVALGAALVVRKRHVG